MCRTLCRRIGHKVEVIPLSKMLQEVFIESDWEDALVARSQRDCRIAELQTQGLICTAENLWNVQGYRVYLLVALPDVAEVIPETSIRRERSERKASSKRPVRRSPSSIEVR